MNKVGRLFKLIIAHIWNSIKITTVAIIWTIPYIVRGGFEGARILWMEVVPDLCERQNKLYATYWKTGKYDISMFEEES